MAGPHRTAHVRHRDRMLARTRRLTLWVAGGAIAAAAGLGIEFAHALPGHASPTAATRPAVTPSLQHVKRPARQSQSDRTSAEHGRREHRSRPRAHIAAPAKKPASTPAAPVVTSGGT